MTETASSAGKLFALLDTQNPAEFTLVTFVDRTNIRLSDIPAIGSAYLAFKHHLPSLLKDHASWTYIGMKTDAGPADKYALYWIRPRSSEEERNTPFRVSETSHPYSWPKILLFLRFVYDNKLPRVSKRVRDGGKTETVATARVYERKAIIPGVQENSKMTVYEYLSDTKFEGLGGRSPQEGFVEWDFNECQGSFVGLHPDVSVPARGSAYKVAYEATTSSASQTAEERLFPATGFTSWRSFVFSDEQRYENGQWYRRKCVIHPPRRPKTILE